MQMEGVIVERIPVSRFLSRKVKFWFGMYVWQNISEKHNIPFEDFDTLGEDALICDVLYYAQEYGFYKDGKPKRKLSFETIKKSYEMMPQKQLERIAKCMVNSRIGGNSIIGFVEGDKKKQAPTT